jgi:hypothetical protein
MTAITDLIAHRQGEILALWTDAMQKFRLSDDLPQPELSDVMPAFLSSLGRIGADGSLRIEQLELIERHLSRRIRHGFVLNEVLTEYAALGRCISKLLAELPEAQRPSAPEVSQLFGELHLTSIAASAIFNEHMLEDEQSEKRYRQRLQQIASVALRAPSGSALHDMLGVVASAVGAHTAAVVVYDRQQGRLVRSLARGVEPLLVQEHLDRHFGRGGEMVAELEPTEVLRARGIGALVGVPLALEEPRHGALYVARADGHRLSASDRRRLDALSDTVALYLETSLGQRDEGVGLQDIEGALAGALARLRELAATSTAAPSESLAGICTQLAHVQAQLRALLAVRG